jgi:hypothetical protein
MQLREAFDLRALFQGKGDNVRFHFSVAVAHGCLDRVSAGLAQVIFLAQSQFLCEGLARVQYGAKGAS